MTERMEPVRLRGEAFGAETGFVVGWMCFVNCSFFAAGI